MILRPWTQAGSADTKMLAPAAQITFRADMRPRSIVCSIDASFRLRPNKVFSTYFCETKSPRRPTNSVTAAQIPTSVGLSPRTATL